MVGSCRIRLRLMIRITIKSGERPRGRMEMRRVVCRTGLVLALIGLAVAGGTPARAAGLSLVRPHEGDAVRETVKVVAPLPEINSKGFAKVTAFVEDVQGGQAFMRERRTSPITISYGDVAQSVPVDESSRYFTLYSTGFLVRSAAMSREKRTPLYNQL